MLNLERLACGRAGIRACGPCRARARPSVRPPSNGDPLFHRPPELKDARAERKEEGARDSGVLVRLPAPTLVARQRR
jgi:hypothetical protein